MVISKLQSGSELDTCRICHDGTAVCERCHGKGQYQAPPFMLMSSCRDCDGIGKFECRCCHGSGMHSDKRSCYRF